MTLQAFSGELARTQTDPQACRVAATVNEVVRASQPTTDQPKSSLLTITPVNEATLSPELATPVEV